MPLFAATMTSSVRRIGLPVVVFAAGLAASAYGYFAGVRHSEAEQIAQLQETAENYAHLLRNRLALYEGADNALAAFFSASYGIRAEEFDNYIGASRVFERLDGASSFGYLPRVPEGRAARFEAESGKTFPGYRISGLRPDTGVNYPLLYAVDATDSTRAARLRGIDFSSIPERWAAMQEAEERDEPVATRVHADIKHPSKPPVVLVFSPVRSMHAGSSAARARQQGGLTGFIFSAIYVDKLFLRFDNGRLASLFDVEVFDGTRARSNLIFDADGKSHALESDPARLLAHRADIKFASRTWLVHFYAKKASLEARAAWAGAMVLALGLLLTLIAAYAASAWPRHLSHKRSMRDFSQRFAGFFEKHPFAVYAVDAEQRFIHANQQLAKELGVSRDALIGTPVQEFDLRPRCRRRGHPHVRPAGAPGAARVRFHGTARRRRIRPVRGRIASPERCGADRPQDRRGDGAGVSCRRHGAAGQRQYRCGVFRRRDDPGHAGEGGRPGHVRRQAGRPELLPPGRPAGEPGGLNCRGGSPKRTRQAAWPGVRAFT